MRHIKLFSIISLLVLVTFSRHSWAGEALAGKSCHCRIGPTCNNLQELICKGYPSENECVKESGCQWRCPATNPRCENSAVTSTENENSPNSDSTFVGHRFDCGSTEIFFATRNPGGQGSGLVINGVETKAVFTTVSSYPIYQTRLALLALGPDTGVYFIKKRDASRPRAGRSYEIRRYPHALVDVDDPHKSYACSYLGETYSQEGF